MKKIILLFFISLLVNEINAQIMLSGSSLFVYQVRFYQCTNDQLSVNGTYFLDGTFNGKNRYSLGVSLTSVDDLICTINNQYVMSPRGVFYIQWSNTNNNWELGFYGYNASPLTFVVISTLTSNTTDPPCGVGFGGTIAGAGCSQNCTNSMTVSGTTAICSGASATITATGCSGAVTWNNNGGTGALISVSPSTTTTYTATCTTSGICSGSATITVTRTPIAPIITTSTPTLCTGSTASLTYNSCSAGSILWSDGYTGTNKTTTINGIFTATCVNGACSSPNSNSISVSFHTTPSISGSTCIGSTLTATGFGSVPLQWSKDGIELTGATSATYIPTQAGSYQVTTTASKGAWTSLTSPSNLGINGVNFIDPSTGWVADDGGKIYKTMDAGTSWILQTSGITTNIQDIFFTSASNGIAVGNGGKILHTIDGGTTWTLSVSNTTNDLYDVFFLNATTGWAVGGKYIVLKTTDGGATWTTISIDNTATNSDHYSQVQFADVNNGYVSGGKEGLSIGFVKKSIDGGSNWTDSFSSGFMYGLSFIDANTGWTSGANVDGDPVVSKTTNGGITWNNQYFEGLSVSNSISAVQFIDANRGWIISSNYKSAPSHSMLSTSDGGTYFSKDITTNGSQITSQANGKRIFMLPDGTSGWMVGTNYYIGSGYIMKFSNKVCSSNSLVVNTPSIPTISPTGTQSLCATGSLLLTASGCNSGTYTWSNGSTGATLNATQPGNYTVTCSINSCTSAASAATTVTGNCPCLLNSSISSGNWNNNAIWSCGHIPLVTEPVRIITGHTVILNANGIVKSLDLRGVLQKQSFSLRVQGN